MPIQVQDFNWSQSADKVVVRVPLKGTKPCNVDIFSTNEYIKASFAPYLFEAFLQHPVEDDTSKAAVGNGMVVFTLAKSEELHWTNLNCDDHKDKSKMKERREEAVSYAHQRSVDAQTLKSSTHHSNKRFTVDCQMSLEQEEKQQIEEVKREEKQKMIEYTQTLVKQSTTMPMQDSKDSTKAAPQTLPASKEIPFCTVDDATKPLVSGPRNAGTIEVKFTKRVFATPSRESKLPEEEAWLQKVAEMNKIKSSNRLDAVDVEEMNPMWLKDKGNTFYKNGHFVAAINAYTAGLILNDKIPSIYSNRAACHLHMKQYNECIQDCTMALELFDPPVLDNLRSRCRVLSRRATAFYLLEAYDRALEDYDALLTLDPSDKDVIEDAARVREKVNNP